MQRVFLKQMLL